MAFFLYASFPNSRNRNRAPTIAAKTHHVTIANNAAAIPTLLAPADLNRTYLSIENTSLADDMYFGYANTGAQNPTVTATFGIIYDLFLSTTTNLLYVKNDTGTTTNWTVTTLGAAGFLLRASQIAGGLESLQNIYGQSDTVNPIIVDLDEGRG